MLSLELNGHSSMDLAIVGGPARGTGRDTTHNEGEIFAMQLRSYRARFGALLATGGLAATLLSLGPVSSASAQSLTHTDPYGNTTGTVDGQSVSLHTDAYGNTTGTIGGQSVSIYSDPYGNTTGRVGNQSVSEYSDPYGNTSGRIGNQSVSTYTDPYGNTSGRVGNRSVSSYTDPYGNTTGR